VSLVIYIAVMAGVTYLIRMIPFAAFRRQIKSRFFRSFLYYVPYAVLTAMTVPAIFYSTGSAATAAFGTAVALLLAYFDMPLIVVALAASAAAFAAGFILPYIGF
jgi:Predicted membrane protein